LHKHFSDLTMTMPLPENFHKEAEKYLQKELRELTSPSWKATLITFLGAIIVSIISMLHGIDQNWAWEVARNLITINGLVLGFAVVASTVLSSRGFTRTAYKMMIEDAVDKFMERARDLGKVTEATATEFIKKEFLPMATSPAYSMGVIQGTFNASVEIILTSIVLSLCLFGVSGTATGILLILFINIYWTALWSFIYGAYKILKVIFAILGLGARFYIGETWKFVMDRLEEMESQQKKEEK
jgi:hypothetical protein